MKQNDGITSIYTRLSQGRSQPGTTANRIAPTQWGLNITVCIAVSATDGMVSYEIIEGAMTKDRTGLRKYNTA